MDILTYAIVITTIIILTIQIKRKRVSLATLVWSYLLLIGMFIVTYPPLLNKLSHFFGFDATENFIFFVICGYLFVITIVQEVRIAKMNDDLKALARELSLIKKEDQDVINSDDN